MVICFELHTCRFVAVNTILPLGIWQVRREKSRWNWSVGAENCHQHLWCTSISFVMAFLSSAMSIFVLPRYQNKNECYNSHRNINYLSIEQWTSKDTIFIYYQQQNPCLLSAYSIDIHYVRRMNIEHTYICVGSKSWNETKKTSRTFCFMD